MGTYLGKGEAIVSLRGEGDVVGEVDVEWTGELELLLDWLGLRVAFGRTTTSWETLELRMGMRVTTAPLAR